MEIPNDTRRKRRRRIALVSVILLAMIVLAGGFYGWRHQRHVAHIDTLKPRGLEHLEAGEYGQALHRLNVYLNRYPDDLEALRGLAEARSRVYDQRGAHVRQTIGILRRILRYDPHDEKAQRELLDLYASVGQNTEALEIAERLLVQHPDDAKILRHKARVLAQMNRHERALEIIDRYGELEPGDIEIQSLALRVMRAKGEANRAIVDRAHSLAQAHAGDGRFLLLLGFAHQITGDREQARSFYLEAVEQMPEEADEIGRLARRMDEVGLSREATDLLQRAQRRVNDPELVGLFFRRLWELGRTSELRERGEELELDDPHLVTESLAVLALAHLQAGDSESVSALIEKIGGRRHDGLAQAWAGLLETLADEQADAQRLINVSSSALLRYPHHPYFHFYHGQGLSRDAQPERAIESWTTAGQRAPVWAMPLLQIARTFLATDRPLLAIQTARAALQRAPGHGEAILTMLEAQAAHLDQLDDQQLEQFEQMIEQVLAEAPEARRRLLPMMADIQARRGQRQAAIEQIEQGLDMDPPLSERVLLQLAGVSERHDLDLVEQCLRTGEESLGMTPRLAFGRAMWQMRQGSADAEAVVEDFDAAARSARDRRDHSPADSPADAPADVRADTLSWALTRARLLEAVKPDDALDHWRDLIEEMGQERRILEAAVQSEILWRDRATMAQAISRLGELTEERGTSWRIARARQLMQDADSGDRALAEASLLLLEITRESPYLLEPRVLLARCFGRMERPQRALDMLEQAQQLAPDSLSIALDRAAMLIALDRGDEADVVLERLRRSDELPSAQIPRLARLLINRGDIAGAERTLDNLLHDQPRHRQARLLLAQIYAHQRRTDEAEALYQSLLEEPDAAALQAAARFHERSGQIERARDLLGRLDEVEIDEDARVLILARFHQRHGQSQRAAELLTAAVTDGDAQPDVWRHLIALKLAQGQIEEALALASDAAALHSDDEGFASLVQQRRAVQRVAGQPMLRRLAMQLLVSDEHREAATRALELTVEADRTERPMSEVARELRRLGERFPRLVDLQQLVVSVHQAMGRHDEAADIAVRTMRTLPADPQAGWLAADALTAAERWQEAIEVAAELRQRSPERAMDAALLTAEARLRLGDGARAVEALSPHLHDAAGSERSFELHRTLARALIRDGRTADAREMLRPHISESSEYRNLFMDLAVLALEDADDAADWLNEVAEAIAPDALTEQLILARSWRALDERYERERHTPQAVDLIRSITEHDQAPASAFEMLGMIHDAQGRTAEAEAAYRAALVRDEDRGISQNNLAVILRDRGEVDEALELARRAVSAEPRRAAFHNTLAMTLLASDRPGEAVEAAQRALNLEPGRVEWYLTFGETLIEARELDRARELVDWLDERLAQRPELAEDLRTRFQSLRDSLETLGASRDGDSEQPPDRLAWP